MTGRLLLPLFAILLIAGCSTTNSDGPTVAYHDAKSTRSLQVPPDLTKPTSRDALQVGEAPNRSDSTSGSASAEGSRTYSGKTASATNAAGGGHANSRILPTYEHVHFRRGEDGNAWLEVDNADPEQIWPRIGGFLNSQGLSIARREPELGIIQTNWAERQDGPKRGGIGGFLNSFLSNLESSGVRDQYQFRLERMDGGGTRIFVSQRSAQLVDASKNPKTAADLKFAQKAGDPALEAEMARRLLVYLGVSEQRSKQIVAHGGQALGGAVRYFVEEGAARIMVFDPNKRRVFARAGNALSDIGASVQSVQRDKGIYIFDWNPAKGDAESDNGQTQTLQLHLAEQDDAVRIKAADRRGNLRSGPVERKLLRRLAMAMGANPADVRAAAAKDKKKSNQSNDDWLNKRPNF